MAISISIWILKGRSFTGQQSKCGNIDAEVFVSDLPSRSVFYFEAGGGGIG
jgi:hypothetical protein